MNIVLVGAGEVGFNLSKVLSKEGYNLTIIDTDPHKCNRVNNSIDAKVIEGNGASQRILQKINGLRQKLREILHGMCLGVLQNFKRYLRKMFVVSVAPRM